VSYKDLDAKQARTMTSDEFAELSYNARHVITF
jgi:hypothetical protein